MKYDDGDEEDLDLEEVKLQIPIDDTQNSTACIAFYSQLSDDSSTTFTDEFLLDLDALFVGESINRARYFTKSRKK